MKILLFEEGEAGGFLRKLTNLNIMGTLKENVTQALSDCTQLIARINSLKMNAGYAKDDQLFVKLSYSYFFG